MDPRTRDAIRQIPEELKSLKERVTALEELCDGIFRLARSTNESVVRKYGEKNTAKKVVKKIKKAVKGK